MKEITVKIRTWRHELKKDRMVEDSEICFLGRRGHNYRLNYIDIMCDGAIHTIRLDDLVDMVKSMQCVRSNE